MNNLNIAKIEDMDMIYSSMKLFIDYVRKDTLRHYIENQNVILQDKTIIVFRKYKKRVQLNNIYAPKDSYIIYHLINLNKTSHKPIKILNQFCNYKSVFYRYSTNNQMKIQSSIFSKCGFKEIVKTKNKIVLFRKDLLGISK